MPNETPNSYKWKLFLVFLVAYTLFYIFPNLYPPWKAVTLPLTSLDLWVPFIPWTFAIYTSDYTLFLVVIILIKDRVQFNSFARLLFGTLFICGSFFIFYPTTYPRPVYPEVENPILRFLLFIVGTADAPNNCFPSMHVALTCSATWGVRHLGKKYFYSFAIWSFLIIVSTLTTKQHYLADIIGGLLVTVVVCLLEHFIFQSPLSMKWGKKAVS